MLDDYALCKGCGAIFHKYRPYQLYCSDKCRNKRYATKYSYKKKEAKTKTCKECNKEFTTNDSKRKYCSDNCRIEQ